MATKPVTVTILGDASSLEKAFQQADDSAGKAGTNLTKVGAAIGGAFAATQVIDFGRELLDTGTKIDSTLKKANTVFEGQSGAVQKWASDNAAAMGLTKSQLTGLAAGFGDLVKPMGFSADQAAEMSTKTLDLAGALSAWSGGKITASDASEKLAKAYLGERDGLVELGIKISDADVQARLLAKGQDKLTGQALEQAKALATQELIFEKSTDAQKAWSDGSADAVKAQNEVKASIGEAKDALATALFPAFQAIARVVADDLVPILKNFLIPAIGDFFQVIRAVGAYLVEHKALLIGLAIGVGAVLVPAFIAWAASAGAAAAATIVAAAPVIAIGAAIAALAAGIIYAYNHFEVFRTVVDAIGNFLANTLWPILRTIGEVIGVVIVGYVKAVIWQFRVMWETAQTLGAIVADVFNTVSGWLSRIVGIFLNINRDIANALTGVVSTITAPFRSAFNGIAELWNNTVGSLSFTIPSWVPVVGGKGFDVPNIPTFRAMGGPASGWTVLGERGPEPVWLPPGSVVQASHTARTEGHVINIHAGTQATPKDIGDALAWALRTAS